MRYVVAFVAFVNFAIVSPRVFGAHEAVYCTQPEKDLLRAIPEHVQGVGPALIYLWQNQRGPLTDALNSPSTDVGPCEDVGWPGSFSKLLSCLSYIRLELLRNAHPPTHCIWNGQGDDQLGNLQLRLLGDEAGHDLVGILRQIALRLQGKCDPDFVLVQRSEAPKWAGISLGDSRNVVLKQDGFGAIDGESIVQFRERYPGLCALLHPQLTPVHVFHEDLSRSQVFDFRILAALRRFADLGGHPARRRAEERAGVYVAKRALEGVGVNMPDEAIQRVLRDAAAGGKCRCPWTRTTKPLWAKRQMKRVFPGAKITMYEEPESVWVGSGSGKQVLGDMATAGFLERMQNGYRLPDAVRFSLAGSNAPVRFRRLTRAQLQQVRLFHALRSSLAARAVKLEYIIGQWEERQMGPDRRAKLNDLLSSDIAAPATLDLTPGYGNPAKSFAGPTSAIEAEAVEQLKVFDVLKVLQGDDLRAAKIIDEFLGTDDGSPHEIKHHTRYKACFLRLLRALRHYKDGMLSRNQAKIDLARAIFVRALQVVQIFYRGEQSGELLDALYGKLTQTLGHEPGGGGESGQSDGRRVEEFFSRPTEVKM